MLRYALAICMMILPVAAFAQSADETARVSRVIDAYAKLGYLNGSVLVSDQGRVIVERGVGEANMTSHVQNTPQTKFGIASITKQFTALLILQQVEAGRVRLDVKLSDYLPWYRADTGGRITIEQLMHHTSGLPADFDDPENSATEAASKHDEPEPFAQAHCQRNLAAAPGTQWAYSNCGYILLGLVLEHVTGEPFERLLRERILEPLGMRDSGMDHNDLVEQGGAVGYRRLAGVRYRRGPYIDQGHIFSAGSMYSTVEDLWKWNEALRESSVISPSMREAIFTADKANWGYGWFVTKLANGSTLEEMRGDMPDNYFATIRRYPERRAAIIVLRNGYGSTERFEENVEAVLFGQEPRLPGKSVKDVAAQVWFGWGKWAAGVVVIVGLVGVFRRLKAH